jgi:hypothetical protein
LDLESDLRRGILYCRSQGSCFLRYHL